MRVGLVGLGHLGKIHYRCLQQTAFELVGIVDPLYEEYYKETPVFSNLENLLKNCDACIVATTTSSHYSIVNQILNAGKHCFVEKPLTDSLQTSEALLRLAQSKPSLITQVGFVERYNPGFTYVLPYLDNPKFIEIHRLAPFNPRGNDVSVVFDLMIHDIDLLLTVKPEKIVDVRATGVKVFTDTLDICNCRIEFEDGAVANITSSRVSLKVMRKFRIFQSDAYISIDLHKKEGQIIYLSKEEEGSMAIDLGDETKYIMIKSSGTQENNAIVDELSDFYDAIQLGRQSKVNFNGAVASAKLATLIEKKANNA